MLDPLTGAAGSPGVIAATGDAAWLDAMLEVERVLAAAAARVGLVEAAAADEVVRRCDPARFDLPALAAGYAGSATPVIALTARLRELVPRWAHPAVHPAATSQDVIDTAAMLVARRALATVLDDAAAVAELLAGLAREHRGTPMLGRTLGQHAAVTSFGLICAARMTATDDARAAVESVCRRRLAVQLGGPVGTLAAAGDLGPALVAEVARDLDLVEPVLPWHTSRARVGELAGALGVLSGELSGVATDVVVLSGSDIGEVSVARPGGSSSMSHKRNPAPAVLAVAAAHRVPGLVATLLAGMPQELQRAAGRWQAEPAVLTELLRGTGTVARQVRACLTGLGVHREAMARAVRAFAAGTGADPDPGTAGIWVDRALAAHDGGGRR